MDAKKLEILMTAVDLGSFSKASEVVGYTQSGLTHLVDSLEREIGFPLIRRSYSGIALTEAGENLLPDIRQFLQANATLENKIQAVREPLNGRNEFPLREFEGKDFLMPYGRFDIDVHAAFAKEGVRAKEQSVYVDDETVIRMVGKGLGISMMSELMIRGNTEDVYCVPVSPTCIREIGMGMKPGAEESGSIVKLRECVMQFVSTLNKGGNVSLK